MSPLPSGGPGHQRDQMRSLAEGALLAAIAAVLVLAANLIPPLFILSLVAPVPLVVAVVRNGMRVGLLAGLVATSLLTLFLGLPALLAGLIMTATGVGLGVGLLKGWPVAATLTLGTLISLGSILLTLWVSLQLMGIDLIETMLASTAVGYEQSLALWQQAYERFGSATDLAPIEAEMARALEMLPLLVPGVLTAAATVTAFISYSVAAAILVRLGSDVPAIPPFSRWNLPTSAVYALITVFAAIRGAEYFGFEEQFAPLLPAFMSAAWLLQLAVLTNGLTTSYFFLQRWRLPRWLTVVILVLGFANPWFQALFFWIGFLEPFLKVRRRFNGPQEEQSARKYDVSEKDVPADKQKGGESDESNFTG